ncbi:uncharacterized protein LOC109847405 [Asparagus officinalis]|uniref:uncharacterized protein LOC109847405 n=1 Tax=Asparagus officinalis TaxID=4686 RepID=UPI00098E3E54|nr:uncharacterized protein LOC109847405 [Asparagus officinalis]
MEAKLKFGKDPEGTPVDMTQYRSVIGCLRYLTHTRPDISYAVGIVSRYMEKPTVVHRQAVKHILRYVKGTVSYGLVYRQSQCNEELVGFTDSDLAGDVDDRHSKGGMTFNLGDSLVTWTSQKQKMVALSSCEAKFMAATAIAS